MQPDVNYMNGRVSHPGRTVVDDGKADWWTAKGKAWVLLPAGGDYEICQTKPAPNTELADPACKQITVKYTEAFNAGFFMSKPI